MQAQDVINPVSPNVNFTLKTTAQPVPADAVAQQIKPLAPIGQLQQITEPKDDPGQANIYLNFEAASLASVVNYLAEQKKINIVPHKDLDNSKVTLTTRKPLTLERAWNILLTLLEMNAFSIIKVGPLYRIVQSQNNGFEPLPTYSSETGTPPDKLPDSDMVVRYVYFLKNIKAEQAKGILDTMLGDKSVMLQPDLNACIIKEQCYNIKSALKIINELDTGGLRESIKIIRLKHANADVVSKLFEDICGKPDDKTFRFTASLQQKTAAYFSSTTKILPDLIKNNLILLGTENDINKIIDFIDKYIDVPIGTAESRLHVKEVKYAKAENIKPIIEQIIKPPKGQGTEKSSVVGEYKFFEDVIIKAEEAKDETTGRGGGNRLIIACNQDDWRRIDKFINQLDKPQPQVALEIMIVDLGNTQNKELGAQTFGILGKKPGMGINGIEFMNLTDAVSKESATPEHYIQIFSKDVLGNESPTCLTIGRAASPSNPDSENIWSAIRAVYNVTNNQIVSQPYIVANNYQKCTVTVGETRKLPGSLVSTKGELAKQVKDDVPANVTVNVTPQINLNGIVDLTIDISIDEFKAPQSSDTPPKTNRKITTKASMATGEVLVLGGLMKSNLSEDIYKTPILGDIPIIGNLFKSKTKTKEEQNLYVFIRPSIIKPSFEGVPDEYTQLKLDYAKYQLIKNDTYAQEKNDPIQRWFFKPTHQSIKHKMSDINKGILRPLDDYTYGKNQPKSVNVAIDPFYKVAESIDQAKKRKAEKRAEKLKTLPTVKVA